MIPQETIDRIIDTARVEEVVGDFVQLKRRGANYVACCPFHNEKTPSFSVSPIKGIYKCFGCGETGTSIGFLMKHENMSYVEAIRYLGRKYHIEIVEEAESEEVIQARERKESLIIVSEFAAKHFHGNLSSGEGRAVGYAYFKSRGLEDETIERFKLGWASSSRKALANAAREAGYKEEYLLETGLCTRYDDGNIGDRFYDRAIFPICSPTGRTIAFGGRTLRTDKTVAKYVNSHETEIYIKNQTLYGMHLAKQSIGKTHTCILVEGYLDVISMHQLGICNVVASCGTSLTENQVHLMKKTSVETVIVMYDGDSAGIKASLRAIDLLLEADLNVKLVQLPAEDDPDSYAKTHTLEEFNSYIEERQCGFMDFILQVKAAELKDPLKKTALIQDIADRIALIPDAIKRTVFVDECARLFGMDSDTIFDRVKTRREKNIIEAEKQQQRPKLQERPRAQETPQADAMRNEQAAADAGIGVCETELMEFILRYGCESLDFEETSEFFCPEGSANVAEFVDSALHEDSLELRNPIYRQLYDKYFVLYDEGLSQSVIQQRLMNDMDSNLAHTAVSLIESRYELTVESYRNSMTSLKTRLVTFVPRSILVYKLKLNNDSLDAVVKQMAEEPDNEDLVNEFMRLTRVKQILSDKLGRI